MAWNTTGINKYGVQPNDDDANEDYQYTQMMMCINTQMIYMMCATTKEDDSFFRGLHRFGSTFLFFQSESFYYDS
jgi:hypothetical protein